MMDKVINKVPPEALTVDQIRKVMVGFNQAWEREGGFKDYDVQAIEALLAEIDRLREWLLDMDYADHCEQCKANAEHERRALRGDPPRGTEERVSPFTSNRPRR